MKHWQTKSSEVKYENPWISVREDKVIRPDGSDGVYGVVSAHTPGVFIVPVDEEGNTYINLQERYTNGIESWETPAGATDGDPIIEAAKRELLEETGLEAREIIEISKIYPAVGYSSAYGIVCIATGLKKITNNLDPIDGILELRKLPLNEVKEMIVRGEITDGVTISAVLTVIAYLEKNPL